MSEEKVGGGVTDGGGGSQQNSQYVPLQGYSLPILVSGCVFTDRKGAVGPVNLLFPGSQCTEIQEMPEAKSDKAYSINIYRVPTIDWTHCAVLGYNINNHIFDK